MRHSIVPITVMAALLLWGQSCTAQQFRLWDVAKKREAAIEQLAA